ncbi:MAG TPA: HAMP domain-containing protein [Rhodocyclaceae bacterium]|nr:HAMP domain-containing protein [Rhodocyclaceae bacterium]
MDMIRLLMGRVGWTTLVCLAVFLALAAWRAEVDIRREGQGAAGTVRLLEALAALQASDGASRAARLDELRQLGQAGRLRHLRFQLEDADGRVLVAAEGAPVAGGRVVLKTADGQAYRVALSPDARSEQEEAAANIGGMAALFMAYGLVLLAGLYLAARHALKPLRRLLEAIASLRQRDFSVRVPPLPVQELDSIGAALNHLGEGLAAAETRQRALHARLLTVQDDEQARLALRVQESFGQELTALRSRVACLRRQSGNDPVLAGQLAALETSCRTLDASVRGMLRDLHPDVCAGGAGDGASLAPLLHELVKSWQDAAGPGTEIHEAVMPPDRTLPGAVSRTLYRMTQEALANVVRHASARCVSVSVRDVPDDAAAIEWEVRDDGCGIADLDAAMGRGSGLAALRERVWALGGWLQIGPANAAEGASAVSPGLCLRARLPVLAR